MLGTDTLAENRRNRTATHKKNESSHVGWQNRMVGRLGSMRCASALLGVEMRAWRSTRKRPVWMGMVATIAEAGSGMGLWRGASDFKAHTERVWGGWIFPEREERETGAG